MQPYVRSDGFNSVVYTGFDDHIYELYLWAGHWYFGIELFLTDTGWQFDDLTAQAGAAARVRQ